MLRHLVFFLLVSVTPINSVQASATDPVLTELNERSQLWGAIYLWGRLSELFVRGAGYVHGLGYYGEADHEGAIVSAVGAGVGNIANVFQGAQGALDFYISWRFYDTYKDSDKIQFAAVAIIRGGLNVFASVSYMVYVATNNTDLGTASYVAVGIANALAFIKNTRDVSSTQGAMRAAYFLCTVSRFPFIVNAILSSTSTHLGYLDTLAISNDLRAIAMVFFGVGALIRQHLYHFPPASN